MTQLDLFGDCGARNVPAILMSTTTFTHDVFLSHSSKDKKVVRAIAGWLRKNGLKVWFEEWEIRPGHNNLAKIDKGLDRSRVLVLFMSANAFDADWVQLEAGVARFRDAMNKACIFSLASHQWLIVAFYAHQRPLGPGEWEYRDLGTFPNL